MDAASDDGASSKDMQNGAVAPIRFAVGSSVAAWIVGRRGKALSDLRNNSGAEIEVSRQSGPYSVVEIGGLQEARFSALKLLLKQVEDLPNGAPAETRMLIPQGAVGYLIGRGGQAIRELRRESGAEMDMVRDGPPGPNGEQLLSLSGPSDAVALAAQLVAEKLAEANVAHSIGNGSNGRGALALTSSRSGFNASGSPLAGGMLAVQSPNEAALVKALLVDRKEESEAELSLLFPRDVIRRVLVPKGRLQAVAKRSGSQVKLGTDKASASQLVTFTGSRLTNTMAVLYLQELLIEHDATG